MSPWDGDSESALAYVNFRILRSPLKAKRDRAILSALFYHALRRAELCTLKVKDIYERCGVNHFRVHGKGGKLRNIPIHAGTLEAIADYLARRPR